MDFWNDVNTFVTQRKKKMWIQTICHKKVKIKIKKYATINEEFKNKMN
jgi:hypothetical protein